MDEPPYLQHFGHHETYYLGIYPVLQASHATIHIISSKKSKQHCTLSTSVMHGAHLILHL